MIFPEELKNAEKFGYKFQRKNIFKDYVTTLYNLRSQYPKGHPLNLITKLLLNSLYGRFGMIDSFPTIEIIDKNESIEFIENSPNMDIILYYSDTDSIYIDKPLPPEMVDSKSLGKMKLENVLTKAIFLAPKVYYLETVEGNISVIEQLYTLKVTDNKRKLIYNEDNTLYSTEPYIIDENNNIINK